MTHYELSGKGKLVVLLHGWGDQASGLQALAQRLAKHYKVLAIDLPGFGATQPPTKVWNLDNYGEFVRNVLQKLNLGEPYAVIGHSNGGAIAIRAAALHLLEPEKLVLLASAGVRTSQPWKRLILKVVAKVGKVATFWLPQQQRRKLQKRLYGVAGSDMLVVPTLQETFKRTVRQDVQADAAQLTVPALLLYADNDAAVPVEDGDIFHRLMPQSRLEIINNAGHFLHIDQPEQVSTLIEEFLS